MIYKEENRMNKILFFVVTILLLLSGCSGEDIPRGVSNNTLMPLSVSSASFSVVATRSDVTNGSIGVFLGADNGYTPKDNYMYTCTGGAWTKGQTDDIYLGSAAASICAYYPYDPLLTDPHTVVLRSQKFAESNNLCYTPWIKTFTNVSHTADFQMSHAYSLITFKITHDATYTDPCSVENITITNAGIMTEGSIDITTGIYGSTTAGTIDYSPSITPSPGNMLSTQVLMVPVSGLTGTLDLVFKVDGKNFKTAIPVVSAGIDKLVANSNYEISVTMKSVPLSGSEVDIIDWIEKNKDNIYIPSIYIDRVSIADWIEKNKDNLTIPVVVVSSVTIIDWTDKPGTNKLNVLN
jgi:archaellum component FlaF (FlaF/FlaG flagellin family)